VGPGVDARRLRVLGPLGARDGHGPPIPAAFTLKLIIALLLLSALRTAAYTIYIYFYSKHDVGKIAPYLFTVPMLSSCSAT